MTKKVLTDEQNLRAAIIFLNLFGLIIDENINSCENNKLKIFVPGNVEVGNLVFRSDSIEINTETVFGYLKASYKKPVATVCIDSEGAGAPGFADWSTNIIYQINGSNINMNGIIQIGAFKDTELGDNFVCHPKLDYFVNDNKLLSVSFQREGKLFSLFINNDGVKETIDIAPLNFMDSRVCHQLTFKKNNESVCYKFCNISGGYKANKLDFLSFVQENGMICERKKKTFSNPLSDNHELMLQIGNIMMMEMDSDIYNTILLSRNLLTSNGVSLFDGFVNASMERYEDDEIVALLGVDRRLPIYNGTRKKLSQIYFGNKFKCIN